MEIMLALISMMECSVDEHKNEESICNHHRGLPEIEGEVDNAVCKCR